MEVFGIGIDIVEIGRIEETLERHGERFLEKILTEAERAYCLSHKRPAVHVAARFAAKEAISKAFGTGIGKDLGWLDVEVIRHETGAPLVRLYGAGAVFARSVGIAEVKISISHARDYAVAHAMAMIR
ncbi:holo-[acyl-carrier protein] synthase [Haloferula luteola]|uniref:Holo-[acyl-carrier-protein] synthase n=1 Tax=Haloferula luteola TaxID=595692 RepID=A0A840V5V0_9BACT|nr:holo-ACP synthase [Haloferula luteola]MBB5353627.1 holo-[acyl-carrier protein] synthase [Haloferula luteola]